MFAIYGGRSKRFDKYTGYIKKRVYILCCCKVTFFQGSHDMCIYDNLNKEASLLFIHSQPDVNAHAYIHTRTYTNASTHRSVPDKRSYKITHTHTWTQNANTQTHKYTNKQMIKYTDKHHLVTEGKHP